MFDFWLVCSAKENEIPAPEDVVDEVENKKRHLNVVFIGHVGKGIFIQLRDPYKLLYSSYTGFQRA